MRSRQLQKLGVLVVASLVATFGVQVAAAQLFVAAAAEPSPPAAEPSVIGPPGVAMAEPIAGAPAAPLQAPLRRAVAAEAPGNASYTHAPGVNAGNDLSPGNGDVMTTMTIYIDFWLPTGQQYESTAAGDTNYENLLIRWSKDLGGSGFHNLITQYNGNNGTIDNNVAFGGSWIDSGTAYPHAGTTADPLGDGDIRTEVHNAVTTNGWTEDTNHIVAVFTGTGIHECMGGGSPCTFSSSNGFCAYHDHFSDSGNDIPYAFMAFDNFVHAAGKTCVAGQTGGDTDPKRGVFPNGDINADAEVNTFSHEIIEAATDPHPNDTWTGPLSEIGDACNFNFAPRNDNGADVFLNGHPYIMQQEYSNAAHTCAMDLPTNGFCAGSVSNVCAPTTAVSKAVDNPTPRVDSTVTYTVSLNNTHDTATETNLSLTDTAPPGYEITSVSAPGATSQSSTTGSFTVAYDTLPVHQARTATVTATVPEQSGTAATNCGQLAGQDLIGTALTGQTTSPCATTTPVKIPTVITYSGPSSGDYDDPATLTATLSDDSFNRLAGKVLHFTLNGAETCQGTTDGFGIATCTLTPGEAAGPYTLTVAFTDTSDPVYDVSTASVAFTVTREETTTAYTGPTVILQGASGVTLQGQLLEDGNPLTPISGRTLTLGLGAQSCTAVTDPSGFASCLLTFTGPLGPEPLAATFAGDAFYLPSADTSKTATVFAFPARGAFTLGDRTVAAAGPTTPLTWWGAQWAGHNSLTAGTAPSAFKGFASTVHLPTASPPATCAGPWKTGPGNSPSPPGTVPAYMGVLVTSGVVQSGSTITGNVVSIIVVKTDAGYAGNPGHPGTGTVVATFC